jgi:hypothetical protein
MLLKEDYDKNNKKILATIKEEAASPIPKNRK